MKKLILATAALAVAIIGFGGLKASTTYAATTLPMLSVGSTVADQTSQHAQVVLSPSTDVPRAATFATTYVKMDTPTDQAAVSGSIALSPTASDATSAATLNASGTEEGVLTSFANQFGAVLLLLIVTGTVATIVTKSVGLDKVAGIVKWAAGLIGGAIGASLRTGASLALMAIALFAIALTAAIVGPAQNAIAGSGGYLGQDGSAGFPMWTLIALGLGSVVLVGGGMVTRRTGK